MIKFMLSLFTTGGTAIIVAPFLLHKIGALVPHMITIKYGCLPRNQNGNR